MSWPATMASVITAEVAMYVDMFPVVHAAT